MSHSITQKYTPQPNTVSVAPMEPQTTIQNPPQNTASYKDQSIRTAYAQHNTNIQRDQHTNQESTVQEHPVQYDKVGLIDQVVSFPIEIQKGKYQSPTTRQSILNDDLKWKEFEYQKEISFNYFSKQTPFDYDSFYEDIISLVQVIFGNDAHNGMIKKSIVENTIVELLQQKDNFIMTQSTLHRLQNDIEKIYNNLKKKNLFKQIFSILHKVLSVESQMVINPNNGCFKGVFGCCSK